jgi:surfactin synthase thioesterase subunit
VFGDWAAALAPHGARLVAYQPPGREWRSSEPPSTSITAMAQEAAETYAGAGDSPPTILFGNSMGALLALEAAHALRELGFGDTERVVVAGMSAPRTRADASASGSAPAAGSGVDPLVLRADVEAVRRYQPAVREPLSCPILAVRGRSDEKVREAEMLAWGDETSAGFQLVTVEGGHIDLLKGRETIAAVVLRD